MTMGEEFCSSNWEIVTGGCSQREGNSDLVELVEAAIHQRYANSFQAPLLDFQSPLNAASEFEHRIEVVLPQGITRQEALAKVHLAAATLQTGGP
jgi:hypothetical protein